MRVLIINTSERIGGAAIAANRLMEALKNNGIKTKMLVRDKQTDQISVVELKKSWWKVWQFIWERVVIWQANHFKKHNLFAVDIANTGTNITALPEFTQADVIHLHWINQGMLSLTDIRRIIQSGKPIVWTMHDMWPFTGICHYAGDCDKYATQCHNCPQLYKGSKKDIAYRTFQKKKKQIKKVKITDRHKYTDMLTSLKNRNYLNVKMPEWEECEVFPQSIVMVDLNNVKYVNDNYGHEEGDQLIVKAAGILVNTQLENSEIIRTDGNEFLIYLVGYSDRQISTYTKKLAKEMKNLPHEFGAAIGYSIINDEIKTLDDAINEATLEMITNKEDYK